LIGRRSGILRPVARAAESRPAAWLVRAVVA
jgi:hypothetical protein